MDFNCNFLFVSGDLLFSFDCLDVDVVIYFSKVGVNYDLLIDWFKYMNFLVIEFYCCYKVDIMLELLEFVVNN